MIAGFIFLRLRGILGKKTGFGGKIQKTRQNLCAHRQCFVRLRFLSTRTLSSKKERYETRTTHKDVLQEKQQGGQHVRRSQTRQRPESIPFRWFEQLYQDAFGDRERGGQLGRGVGVPRARFERFRRCRRGGRAVGMVGQRQRGTFYSYHLLLCLLLLRKRDRDTKEQPKGKFKNFQTNKRGQIRESFCLLRLIFYHHSRTTIREREESAGLLIVSKSSLRFSCSSSSFTLVFFFFFFLVVDIARTRIIATTS